MLGGLSPWHLLILAVIALLVFGGRGKISGIMGDAAKGIKAFREGLKDENETPPTQTTPSLPPANEAPKDPIAR
jgi:sec-independent protein translocase protein TatA